jgi:hypothetical protein
MNQATDLNLERHLFLPEGHAARLAGFLDGRHRPDGMPGRTWDELQHGEAMAISWRDLASLCDAYGAEILDLLR